MSSMHCFQLLVLCCCLAAYSSDKVQIENITKGFKEIDVDGDGKVTLREIKNHLEAHKTVEDADSRDMAKSIFEYYDKNKDGFVTMKEFLPHDEL